ncbi:hypothetical protein DCAR_0314414 [Daucus carota subsp. sativus]|uniref:Uncharacterized protein n=1 Tax=Daucus carota subsp. sativus TaxID=79200 RepID=A0A166CJ35_DAUCS|nr:hypothetical protein DCAR_0314414 [Daucus carota subsp. sativus]
MPRLASLVPRVLVDVSSVKALCILWYPRDNQKAPQKINKHRAMDDIKESIAQNLNFTRTTYSNTGQRNDSKRQTGNYAGIGSTCFMFYSET